MCKLFIYALHFFLKCTLESARLYEMCTFQGTFPLLQPLNNLFHFSLFHHSHLGRWHAFLWDEEEGRNALDTEDGG